MSAMLPTWAGSRRWARGPIDAHRASLRSRAYATAALNPPTAPREVIPVITCDGTRLRVHAYGPADGQVIVLVHGWTCAIEYWTAQINAFADGCRVIAYDQRGHGESERGSSKLSMDLLADDLAAVLDAALPAGRQAVLVGHSLGGMTVQAWAGRYPGRVAEQAQAVLLTNTAPGRLLAETTVIPLLNRPLWPLKLRIPLPLLFGRIVLGMPIFFPPLAPVRWLFARQIMSRAANDDMLDHAMAIVRSCPARVRAEFGGLLAGLDLGESARKLTVPTTVLAGAFDDMTPPVQSERIAAMLAETGSLVEYEVLSTGHLGNTEMSARFNSELTQLLTTGRQFSAAG